MGRVLIYRRVGDLRWGGGGGEGWREAFGGKDGHEYS